MDELGAIAIKALGSVGGTVLALVFQPPSTLKDFIIRSVFAFLSGLLFGDPIRDQYLHWPDTWQMWLASAGIVALASWWVWGAATRIIGAWKPK